VTQNVRSLRAPFGALPDGRTVEAFTLVNAHGIELRAITYGGIIVSLKTPDRDGSQADIVLGFDSLAGYLPNASYVGAIIGRFANRIARGRFTLDATTYQLATNNGTNHLHGGVRGFDQAVWQGTPFRNDDGVGVLLTHTSPDGDEGFPGRLHVRVTYTLTAGDELVVDYAATSDKPTPVNFTQHTYFNLAGAGSRDILDHRLTIDADAYTPVDAGLIPTGERVPVAGTPFDFRTPTAIGARIDAGHPQLRHGSGYDHNFVLNHAGKDGGLVHAARLVEPASGRTLDISTTEPGLQVYSGNGLDGSLRGKGGHPYRRRCGLALETQHFPDSPNQPGFPSTILRPGREYQSRTVFAFGVTR
jgi:aldose 1-epimerase